MTRHVSMRSKTLHGRPPHRELAPGRLLVRRQHLLDEIKRPGRFASRTRVSLPRVRVVALASVAGCAAGALAVGLTLFGPGQRSNRPFTGSRAANSPFLVQAVLSPVWRPYTRGTGSGLSGVQCSTVFETTLGCHGIVKQQPAGALESSRTRSATVVSGGSAAERQLLKNIADSLQPSAMTHVTLISSPRQGVTLRVRATDSSSLTFWQESLLAAAFRDRSKTAGRKVTVWLANGRSKTVPIPPGPARTLRSARPTDAEAARRRFEDAARGAGAALKEVTVYQPDGLAVAAVLETKEPVFFLRHQMPEFLAAIGGGWHHYDGVFIRIMDESGTTLWETSTATRTSSGSVGSRAAVARCSPIGDWGPTATECPQ
jgi:hypothetical protein